ncbi:MAG: HAD family phosphatase [Actinomycetota bacterium]|nr:MAG: HAD family phosphatase [Actinomycetota bacterium]
MNPPWQPGWRPALVGLDVDGTVFDAGQVVGQRLAAAVERAVAAGAHVLPATGRSLSTTAPVAAALGVEGWAVCANGAVLASLDPPQVVEAVTFDPRPVLQQLRPDLPGALFAVEDADGVFRSTRPFRPGALGVGEAVVTPYEQLLDLAAIRIVVNSDAHVDTGLGEVAARFGMHSLLFGIAGTAWLDIGPQGVSKASMLERLRRHLGVAAADTLVIGDGDNDLEMLRWAAVGVAMGHAAAHVQDAADWVTGETPGDGAAEVLEALFG